MPNRSHLLVGALATAAIALITSSPPLRGQGPRLRQIAAVSASDLRSWDGQVDRRIRSRELELRLEREDTLIAGRSHTRYQQTVNGVPSFGGTGARGSRRARAWSSQRAANRA